MTAAGLSPQPRSLAWSRHHQMVLLLLRGATWRISSRASVLVGTVLSAVNQGDQLVTGTIDGTMALRIAANYAIPYTVAGVGYLSGFRTPVRD